MVIDKIVRTLHNLYLVKFLLGEPDIILRFLCRCWLVAQLVPALGEDFPPRHHPREFKFSRCEPNSLPLTLSLTLLWPFTLSLSLQNIALFQIRSGCQLSLRRPLAYSSTSPHPDYSALTKLLSAHSCAQCARCSAVQCGAQCRATVQCRATRMRKAQRGHAATYRRRLGKAGMQPTHRERNSMTPTL